MREKMEERAKGFLATVDISGKLQANTAPTTALASVQEAIIPTTALFKRLLSAASKEFQVLYRINQRTFPKDKYREILDDANADPIVDFNAGSLDIIPTANAEMSSKMHRIQTSQLEMDQLPMVLQSGGNPVPIIKGFFEAIGSDKVDQVFPEDGKMSDADKKMRDEMLAAQKQQSEAAALQAQILAREQDRLDKETSFKEVKLRPEIEKIVAEAMEKQASAQKLASETQNVGRANQRDDMMAQVDANNKRQLGQLDINSRIAEENRRHELHLAALDKERLGQQHMAEGIKGEKLAQQVSQTKLQHMEAEHAAKLEAKAKESAPKAKVAVKKTGKVSKKNG
jgi:hypothetical protein